jgi:two-component system NtrC family sensor kinase
MLRWHSVTPMLVTECPANKWQLPGNNMKLASKLILLFIIAVTAVTTMASQLTSMQSFANLEKRHREIAVSVDSIEMTPEFQNAVEVGNNVYFERMVRTFSNHGTRIRWVWLGDDVESDYRPAIADQTVLKNSPTQKLSITGTTRHGRRKYFTYLPVTLDGRSGAVEIATPLNDLDSQSRSAWLTALFTIVATGLLSIGVVMIAGVRWIASPLAALTEKMQRVGKGDFSSDLKIHSNDELGQLAAAVNQMCDRLRQQQQTIESETNQRIEAIEQLRHADRLKTVGQLAAGFAHEVGTPLNVISGRAEMILGDATLPPEQVARHAMAVKNESERISTIIQKLLDFARRSPSRKSKNDLREVIKHSVELIRPLTDKRGVDVNIDLPSSSAEADFDFNQLQQVMMNLIDNAVDASSENQSVDVILKRCATEHRWTIQIVDHGSGIDSSHRDDIFQPFFTTKGVGSGTGLGLSIVHGIVEEHDGTIGCESEIGLGTTITIELPAL